jgi:multicomponent Na+:H+ antiporter subunit G
VSILSVIGHVLVLIGGVFLFISGLGILRMPDVWNRMHAGTKATTLGSLTLLIGLGCLRPPWFPKLIIIGLFIILTNPVSSHALARAVRNVPEEMPDNLICDDMEDGHDT